MPLSSVIRIIFQLFWRAAVVYLCALAAFISCYVTFLQQDIGLPVSVVLVFFFLLSVLAFYAWTQNNLRIVARKVAILLKEEPLSGLIQYGFQQAEDNLVHIIRGMKVSIFVFPDIEKKAPALTITFAAHAPFNSKNAFYYSDLPFIVNRLEAHDEIFTIITDYKLNYNAQQLYDFCYETVGYLKRQGYTPADPHVSQRISN